MQSEKRVCQGCKKEFLIEPEDFLFYEKMRVPPPTWCPECRMIRRFLFRNNRFLFRRKDDASGKEIFSSFPSQAPVKVYDRDYWWSDKWDPMEYEREYDFSRSFFEQFKDLLYSVPLYSKSTINLINSDYCDQAGFLKNCYLCFDSGNSENSAYTTWMDSVKDSFDIYDVFKSEFCYESSLINQSYDIFFSMDCEHCTDVWFSKDLVGCDNCFGCVNLRNKSYYIFNKPYAKEAYAEELKKLKLGSYRSVQEILKKAHEFWMQFPAKYLHGYHNVNVSGEDIQYAKNVHYSHGVQNAENIKYSQELLNKVTDAYDYTNFGYNSSLIYESTTCGFESSGLKFCWECWDGTRDLEYSAYCTTSSNLFGCVGLRKKEYCIFNKQYTKEEYFGLRDKIVEHMNEMPYIDVPGRTYRYGEFFPLSKEEAEGKGYTWREPEVKEFQTTVRAENLPDRIGDVTDEILKEVIACSVCAKAYRIIPMEFKFLQKMQLPLPRACPNCRFLERFKLINPPKFWRRVCQCNGAADERNIYQNVASHPHGANKCQNEFETSYSSDRQEIVYCESCYQNEVV
jgi:hypothetical protein